MPALGDQPEQRAEDAGQNASAVEQQIEIVRDEWFAALDCLKRARDGGQHHDVDERDRE